MRLTRIFLNITKNRAFNLPVLRKIPINLRLSQDYNQINPKFISNSSKNRIKDDGNGSDNEIEPDLELFDDKLYEVDQGFARDLYKYSPDPLTNRIYDCASIQELLNVFNNNKDNYKSEHLVLSVLVIWDLMKIYRDINNSTPSCNGGGKSDKKVSAEFFDALNQNESFQTILRLIEEQADDLDQFSLSNMCLYLNRLGLTTQEPLLQFLCHKLQKSLETNFEISACSRFLETIFKETTHSSYYMSQDLIPSVFNCIDSCNSVEILGDLTTSLNKLHHVVTNSTLEQYKIKIRNFINDGKISSQEYKTVLKIISFLNYPKWRERNAPLVSKCILSMKDGLNQLNVPELVLLYDIFFKIQEPGIILNDLQRCSSKHIQDLDGISPHKIKLLSSLVYFTSPHMRGHFQKTLEKYVTQCNNLNNLITLRKVLSYVKVSDLKLCEKYWDKVLNLIENEERDDVDVIKLGQNYANFNSDVGNFSHKKIELRMLELMEDEARFTTSSILPHKITSILGFAIMYSDNYPFLEYLIEKIEESWFQINHVDSLRLSLSLRNYSYLPNTAYKKRKLIPRINKVLDKIVLKEIGNTNRESWKHSTLLKSCIYKGGVREDVLATLLKNDMDFNGICSKTVENMTYVLMNTGSLLPEIIDKLVLYINDNPDCVLAFNTSKLLYLCYYLGYQPQNEKFYETVANIVIRDQERMGGLSLIQCALGLCFFNKLPKSFIKSIFNVEFMDKLDAELANCYSKDRYPQRVRNTLMQLNRSVCLDYPDANVPWFHQKYVDELNKPKDGKKLFPQRVSHSLKQVLRNKGTISENFVTPYGYLVDFVADLESSRLAFLLIPQYAFTRFHVHLLGKYQLKIRHLEILGYRVITVNFSEWIDLYYAEDRAEFLSSLIWPEKIC